MSNDSPSGEKDSPVLLPLSQDFKEEVLYPSFNLEMLGVFARLSRQTEKDTALIRLIRSAVNGEPESYKQTEETKLAVIAILKRHPELLFKERIVTDHFGRKIKASPYRLLLGAGDAWAIKQVHESILPQIENGEALAQSEFQAQFPNCPWPPTHDMSEEMLYDERNITQVVGVQAQLMVMVEKMKDDPCTDGQATLDDTIKAVTDLCELFTPKEGEIIKIGLHFPLNILKAIIAVYAAQFNQWNAEKLSFFSRVIIGAAVKALTGVDGQCCKYGIANLDMEQGPDRRDSLYIHHPKGMPPELAPLADKLGDAMLVDPFNGYFGFLTSEPGHVDWYGKKDGDMVPPATCNMLGSPQPGVLSLGALWKAKAEILSSCYIPAPILEANNMASRFC